MHQALWRNATNGGLRSQPRRSECIAYEAQLSLHLRGHRSLGRGTRPESSVASATPVVAAVVTAEFPAAAPGRFINNSTAFVQEFPVRGYEVAPNQRASLVTIANLLQVRVSHAVLARMGHGVVSASCCHM